jgi:hypothetical protein
MRDYLTFGRILGGMLRSPISSTDEILLGSARRSPSRSAEERTSARPSCLSRRRCGRFYAGCFVRVKAEPPGRGSSGRLVAARRIPGGSASSRGVTQLGYQHRAPAPSSRQAPLYRESLLNSQPTITWYALV